MRFFDPRDRQLTPAQARRYAFFEILHTVADFAAAFLFIVGSVLFFFESTMIAGTFCFLFGSLFFAAKPTIRLAREIWLAKRDDVDRLAEKAPEGPGEFDKVTDTDDHRAKSDKESHHGAATEETTTQRFDQES